MHAVTAAILIPMLLQVTTAGNVITNFIEYMSQFGDNSGSTYTNSVHPEAQMTTLEIIRHHGYPAEKHRVQTSDGYVLEMHRMPNRTNSFLGIKKTPILIVHGFLASSGIFVANGKEQSPGFILADEGYDVWLANVRGNRYSRRHVHLYPEDDKFWDFSLDEYALIDIPNMIDYILNNTGQPKLVYIGQSMGATLAFLCLSGKPEYNDKIQLAILQAPVLFGEYLKNPLRILGRHIKEATKLYSILGTNELLPSTEFTRKIIHTLCSQYPSMILCEAAINILGGYNEEQLDQSRLAVYVTHVTAGTSWHVVAHFAQFLNTMTHTRYDQGYAKNVAKYYQAIPPEYNFDRITAPLLVYWGYMDLYADERDIVNATKNTPNVQIEKVKSEKFTHQDFVGAKELRKLHFNELLEVLKKNIS